jgi:hypothetical protein
LSSERLVDINITKFYVEKVISSAHNSSLFNEFVCKLGFFGMSGPTSAKKKPNLYKNELNTFFCLTSRLKASNHLKSLKLAWRFVLTFIKIRSHRKNFSNSDSVEQKNLKYILEAVTFLPWKYILINLF